MLCFKNITHLKFLPFIKMLSLPRDTLIEILSNLEDAALLNLCSSNQQLEQVCNDELLWQMKVAKIRLQGTKNFNESWKQYYINATNIKEIPVFVKNYQLYSIIISYDTTFGDIINMIENNTSQGLSVIYARILFKDREGKTLMTISRSFSNINARQRIGKMLNKLNSIEILQLTTNMTGKGIF